MVVKQLRDTTSVPAFMADFWSFEVKGKLYLYALSRFGGSLYWAVVSASGSLGKPERVMVLSSGVAKTAAEEAIILGGPEVLLSSLKEGSVEAFDHVDKAKEHREKEFNTLLKGV